MPVFLQAFLDVDEQAAKGDNFETRECIHEYFHKMQKDVKIKKIVD
jgi:hypothetical protein